MANLPVDNLIDNLPPEAPRLFIVHHHRERVAQLQQLYAGGEISTITDRENNELFIAYRIGPPPNSSAKE